jgi:EAL and modified HD-GYP domain-containing signal transduction protein
MGVRYVARQPILDLRNRLHGYELLFRSGPETGFSGDGNLATRTMLDNSVLFGLEKLTGGLPAFINCTMESLTGQLVDVLPPSMTVLEILETLEPTPALIEACRELKIAGYRLALDDFVWEPKFEPLVELADYIKVDFVLTDVRERERLMNNLGKRAIAMLAEKIETQQEYQQARSEGFTLFQGYFFCRPVLIKSQKIPPNSLFYIQILQLLQKNPLELHKLSKLVKRDASLTYRLLRLVNSPIFAMRQEVSSIETALVAVGEDAFRRIATLAITSELNASQPTEVLRMSFVRGRFCELAANFCGQSSNEQYLLGMLSLLPAMLRLSMDELAPALPLRDPIREALQGKPVPERALLNWLECHELGDWKQCDCLAQSQGLNQATLVQCYEDALLWAEAALFSAP